jgi:acetyl esterase/lipase
MVMREAKVAPADHRIYYGDHTLQFGDLRLPKGRGPHPVAIVIHGGGWDSVVNLHYISHVAEYLTCLGVATWNIEYRRLNADGNWPVMFQDIGAAADYLRVLATRYPLDLTRVIAIGHSAGGHLGLWLAGRDRLPTDAELFTPNPLPLSGVVSLDGTPNLLKWGAAGGPSRVELVAQILGGGSEDQRIRRNKEASPEELLPLGEPQIFIAGETFRLAHIEEHVAAANAAGDDVELTLIVGGGHFETTDLAHPQAGPAIKDAVLRLLGLTRSPRQR